MFQSIVFIESVSSKNEDEIDYKKIYGSKVDEIECLEIKLQSHFDTICFMKKPVLWPSIAFNFNVPGKFKIVCLNLWDSV